MEPKWRDTQFFDMSGGVRRGHLRWGIQRAPPLVILALLCTVAVAAYSYWNLSSQYSELLNDVQQLQEHLHMMSLKRDNAEKMVNTLQGRLQESDNELGRVKLLNQDHQRSLTELQASLENKKLDLNDLSNKIKSQNASFEDKFQTFQNVINELKEKNDVLSSKNEEMRIRVEELGQRAQQLQAMAHRNSFIPQTQQKQPNPLEWKDAPGQPNITIPKDPIAEYVLKQKDQPNDLQAKEISLMEQPVNETKTENKQPMVEDMNGNGPNGKQVADDYDKVAENEIPEPKENLHVDQVVGVDEVHEDPVVQLPDDGPVVAGKFMRNNEMNAVKVPPENDTNDVGGVKMVLAAPDMKEDSVRNQGPEPPAGAGGNEMLLFNANVTKLDEGNDIPKDGMQLNMAIPAPQGNVVDQ